MTKINWDKRNIEDLERLLMGLSDEEAEAVDWANLPSCDLPDNIDTNEVWAMDAHGNCLTGLIHDIVDGNGVIKHIDDLR